MSLSLYDQEILKAFNAVNEKTGGQGASAAEVTAYMAENKTLAALDSVIDIADCMKDLSNRGLLGKQACG